MNLPDNRKKIRKSKKARTIKAKAITAKAITAKAITAKASKAKANKAKANMTKVHPFRKERLLRQRHPSPSRLLKAENASSKQTRRSRKTQASL
jgi:hypothetical protein